ncbi:hypothetical protein AB1Y20_000248 [Prymnesium parvum]|uniref:Uncharacterized protein n=1 Tax=Prymnesium parvum TaxID=97485 RepID=A0AB34K5T4_PRYPA
MEDFPLHISGALVFFCAYDMFMWLRTTSLLFSPIFPDLPGLRKKAAYSNECLYAQLLLCLLSSCFTSLRIASTGWQWSPSHAPLTAGGVLDPLLEWLDALCIVSYFALAVTSHQTLAKTTGFSIAPSS